MISFFVSAGLFIFGGMLLGYVWGTVRATCDTEERWSNAVRRAAYPRQPLQAHLPPRSRTDSDWDQPNGKCSSCGAPLNAQMVGGYRLHQHLSPSRPPTTFRDRVTDEGWMRVKDSEDWMKS